MTAAAPAVPGLVPFDRTSRSYHQRWWILGVLCLSLLVIIVVLLVVAGVVAATRRGRKLVRTHVLTFLRQSVTSIASSSIRSWASNR